MLSRTQCSPHTAAQDLKRPGKRATAGGGAELRTYQVLEQELGRRNLVENLFQLDQETSSLYAGLWLFMFALSIKSPHMTWMPCREGHRINDEECTQTPRQPSLIKKRLQEMPKVVTRLCVLTSCLADRLHTAYILPHRTHPKEHLKKFSIHWLAMTLSSCSVEDANLREEGVNER